MTVTDGHKRYVFVCAGCDKLAESERSDAITCSTACRVRAHRNGSIKTLRVIAKAWEVTPALIQRATAIKELAPEFEGALLDGTRQIDDDEIRETVYRRFAKRLMAEAKAAQ